MSFRVDLNKLIDLAHEIQMRYYHASREYNAISDE